MTLTDEQRERAFALRPETRVYVAVFTPSNGNSPYVYGVFNCEEHAQEHWERNGDKDGTLRITHESVIRKA